MRYVLGQADWDVDRQGYACLDKQRFQTCYFTLADRFTKDVDPITYCTFLDRVLSHMAFVDAEGGSERLTFEFPLPPSTQPAFPLHHSTSVSGACHVR